MLEMAKKLEPADPKRFFSLGSILFYLFFLWIVTNALGLNRPLAAHWKDLFPALLLAWVALSNRNRLEDELNSSTHSPCILNLPISGEKALRWYRYRFFQLTWFPTLIFSVLSSAAVHEFSTVSIADLLALASMFFLITYSTSALLGDHLIKILRIPKIWGILWIFSIVLISFYFFTNSRIFYSAPSPSWVVSSAKVISWVFPTTWVTPGKLGNGGAVLAIIWCAYGAFRWIKYPYDFRKTFDENRDYFEVLVDYEADEEFEESRETDQKSQIKDQESCRGVTLEPLQLPSLYESEDLGWTARWIRKFLTKRDVIILETFSDNRDGWTFRANLALCVLPVVFMIQWLITNFFPEGDWKDGLTVWFWGSTTLFNLFALLQLGNGLPRSNEVSETGNLQHSFLAEFPISVREILRVSTKITFARSILMAAILIPFYCATFHLLLPEWKFYAPVWIIPAMLVFWTLSRPLFVAYRFSHTTKYRKNSFIFRLITIPFYLILSFGWVGAGALTSFSLIAFATYDVTPPEVPMTFGFIFGGILLAAIAARGLFEIFYLTLRSRRVDWISPIA